MNVESTRSHDADPPIRVLLADDSAEFRNTCRLLLSRFRNVELVGLAEDGLHALTLLARARPNLVLMDVKMPRLNGLEATRKICAGFPSVRVILITLYNSEELQAASLAAGADRFMVKTRLRDELPGTLAQLFPTGAGGAAEPQP